MKDKQMDRITFEKRMYEHTKQILIDSQGTLSESGIRSVCEFESLGSSSEIRIIFFKGDEFFDTFEFFAYYKDKPNITIDEITNYLKETVQEVVDNN